MTPETVLVSVMYANNEIGTVEPIREIAKEVRRVRTANQSSYPYVHTDAAQATNYLDMNVLHLGVDFMTISSGKTYGPYGVGVLFVKRGGIIEPLSYGGSHEQGRRPGTEALPLVSALGEALVLAENMKKKETARVAKLRDMLVGKILKNVPDVTINGDLACVLPNMLSLAVSGVESEDLIIYLDARGIAVSGRSACTTFVDGPSHVILALGRGETAAVRFSLGRQTSREDVLRVAGEFAEVVSFLRGSSQLKSG
jgi:cysteine desulfurase